MMHIHSDTDNPIDTETGCDCSPEVEKPAKKTIMGTVKSKIRRVKRKVFKDKSVALIKLDGIIMDTSGNPLVKKFTDALNEVEEREIKVLVLRINSPGGTVGASQEMYDAVKRLQKKGTTVVASFADVCASGGVYIGCAADKIIANPGTITGSIGVIINSANFKKLYEKIGIDSEVVKSGPYKDILSTHRSLTEEEKAILQGMIDNTYNQFVGVVAKNRNIPVDDVKIFADGRIFTGEQALELGMVDKLGSLKEAIEYAAELVGIEGEPKVIDIPLKKSFIQQICSNNLQNIELMIEYSGVPLWLLSRNL